MNYFKIGGRQYRAEIYESKSPVTGAQCFDVDIDVIGGSAGIFPRARLVRDSRPAARRALKRELERLAIGPDGKRANWTIVRRGLSRASRATASLRKVSRALSLLGGAAAHAGAAFEGFGRAYRSPEES